MTTLYDVLSGLDAQRQASMSQSDQELLQGLVQQDMTRGLGINDRGQVNFAGPVAGYAGALRPSDVPSVNAGADIPVYHGSVISPGTIQARAEAGGPFRGLMPDEQAQQLMRGISAGAATGMPPAAHTEIVEGILGRYGLGTNSRASKQADMLERQFLREDLSKWYNKSTGEQAGLKADQINDYGTLRKDYMKLNPEQLKNKDALATAQDVVQRYLGVAQLLKLPEKKGLDSTYGGAARIKYLRQQGDPAVAELDSLNAQITGLARAFGGDSRVSDKEMALLMGSVIQDGDNMESVKGKMQQLQRFLDTKVKSVGLPWLKTPQQEQKPQADAQAQPKQTAPQSAIDYLKQHPEAADQFKAKYGYLP